MSLKDFLKTAGLVEETPDEISSETSTKKQIVTPIPTPVTTTFTSQTPATNLTVNTGVVAQNYIDHFNQVLEDIKSKHPEIDYFTFKNAFDKTASSQASVMENLRYQLTFSALSGLGLTKDILINSSKTYLDGLSADNNDYILNATTKRDNEVNTRQTQITELTKEVEDKNALIQKLLKEISDSSTQIATLKNEIVEQTNTIDQKQKNFSVTYESVVTQIQNDVNKIQQYIQ